MRRGLVVGKFMPLHRGHQLLIDTALANVDELTVVVYDSFVDDYHNNLMPAQKRAEWVAALYPQVQNVLVMPDPLSGDYEDHDNPKYAEVYADQLAFLGPFTHVFSSEDYGKPFADAITTTDVNTLSGRKPIVCEHVTVDAARDLMPISGTEFRSDMYKYRAYVDPLVYRSLIQKVVFVGTESTGKTTITKRMAKEYGTMATLEFGRTLWEDMATTGIDPTFHDFFRVGWTQYDQEQAAMLHSNRYLFCDTNAWTTMRWSMMYHGAADARLIKLASETVDEYIWFFCQNDFGWVDDGTRELRGGKAEAFQKALYDDLRARGVNPYVLQGSIEERVATVKARLGTLAGLRLTDSVV